MGFEKLQLREQDGNLQSSLASTGYSSRNCVLQSLVMQYYFAQKRMTFYRVALIFP